MLGIVKVRCRKCVLLRGGLDPRITQYIDVAGFTGLFKVPDMEVDHALITALVERMASEDAHVPLTPWRNRYHLAKYRGDAGDSGGWVACHWEDKHELECAVPRVVGPSTFAPNTQLKHIYPCLGENKIQVA